VRTNQITRQLQIITINQYLNACVEKTIKNEAATPTIKNQSKPHQTKPPHQKNIKESTKFKKNPPNSSHDPRFKKHERHA
jgi:hypothetical protein